MIRSRKQGGALPECERRQHTGVLELLMAALLLEISLLKAK